MQLLVNRTIRNPVHREISQPILGIFIILHHPHGSRQI